MLVVEPAQHERVLRQRGAVDLRHVLVRDHRIARAQLQQIAMECQRLACVPRASLQSSFESTKVDSLVRRRHQLLRRLVGVRAKLAEEFAPTLVHQGASSS